jgi:hypothetical protein
MNASEPVGTVRALWRFPLRVTRVDPVLVEAGMQGRCRVSARNATRNPAPGGPDSPVIHVLSTRTS